MESIDKMLINDKTRVILSFANIIVLAVVVWQGATAYNKIENKINKNSELIIYNTSDISENKIDIESNSDDNIEIKVSVAGINVNLERLIFSVDRLTDQSINK
jgi:hypothetical protein